MTRIALLATLAFAAFLLLPAVVPVGGAEDAEPLVISEYAPSEETWCDIRNEWLEGIHATYPAGSWAPMKFEPTDAQLAKLGLPGRDVLTAHRFPQPTLVFPDGTMEVLPDLPPLTVGAAPGLVSWAGAGCFGIRPGALLLTLSGGVVGWCSMGHVYGAPGAYSVSTAGHCGNVGDVATVIAGTGNRNGVTGVVVLDFGKYAKSTGDGGIGRDWALISVDPQFQNLVSPTMCMWGGPIGTYTKTGAAATLTWSRGLPSGVSVTPDPLLVQSIVHYGHGTGTGGPGVGTGRVAQVIEWKASVFSFVGTITPGDSGSASNTVLGDAVGAQREAAGINTHLYVGTNYYRDHGLGLMAGTRATQVPATLANGQLLPYPVPLAGAP